MHATLDETAWVSPWRSRCVAERVALCLGLALWGLLAPTWWAAAGTLVLIVVIALAVAHVPARVYATALATPWAFVLIGAASVAVTLAPFGVTQASLAAAIMLATRACAVTAAVVLLAATCPMPELLAGMRRIGMPSVLVDIAASTYRMIFLLLDRASAIRHAQASRLGYSTRASSLRSLGQLLATVFLSALDRGRRLEAGLAGRGGSSELVALRPANPASTRFIAGIVAANLTGVALVISGWWLR